MKAGQLIMVLAIILLSFSVAAFAEEEDIDYAVPAISDLPVLGLPNSGPQLLTASTLKEDINPFPMAEQIRWFDINRDLHVNDFDVDQFRNIIESLHGEKLSGLQLSIRFSIAQKNQRDAFPISYDLDRDGMFTPYDVDYFTQVVSKLDEGASRGHQLVRIFRHQLQTTNQ